MATKLKVIFKAPGEDPEVLEIEHKLENMQKLVGGYLDCVRIDNKYDLWVNDEGLLLQLPPNLLFPESGTTIVGPVFVARFLPNGESASVEDKDIPTLKAYLKNYGVMHF